MAKTRPTQRTLKALKDDGRICAIVEKWVPMHQKREEGSGPGGPGAGGSWAERPMGFRKDLFGFIDIIALDPEKGIVGIQSCGQAFSEHALTILNSDATENVIEWLKAGGKVELWSWRKVKLVRGGKAERWMPRVRTFTLADFKLAVKATQEPPGEAPKVVCHLCGQTHSLARNEAGVYADKHLCDPPRASKPYPEAEDEEGPITGESE